MKLSLRRANAVRRELIKRGIDKKRIKVLAFGEEKLISENDQVNRRVEFKIIARDVWGDLLDPKSPSD